MYSAALKPEITGVVDMSNIFVSAGHLALDRDDVLARNLTRMHFKHLARLIRDGRQGRIFAVTSSTRPLPALQEQARLAGIDLLVSERGCVSGGEVGVDETLQARFRAELLDGPSAAPVVLVTGDGRGYDRGEGFARDLERAVSLGRPIELMAFESSCSQALRQLADAHGVFIDLTRYYPSITFVEGGRYAVPPSLAKRPRGIGRRLQLLCHLLEELSLAPEVLTPLRIRDLRPSLRVQLRSSGPQRGTILRDVHQRLMQKQHATTAHRTTRDPPRMALAVQPVASSRVPN